jgi:hypothetical protein
MVPIMVTYDVFVVIESLVKNQCKGKPCNFLLYNPLPPFFFFNSLIYSSHLHVSSWSMVFSILIGVGEALLQEFEIRFLAHGAMDVLGIVYPQCWM